MIKFSGLWSLESIIIAAAAEEQSAVASKVDKGILTIRELAESIAVSTKKDEQACQTLNKFSERLADYRYNFKIKGRHSQT